MITVADYIAHFLVEHNIKHVFGYQGSAMLKILDAIMETKKIQYIQNFHEQASSFSADAYARCTNHIGVAIATSGPGAVNLIGGIANAYFDSIPTLFITGQENSNYFLQKKQKRQNGFQDMDIVAAVRKITKYAKLIIDPNQIAFELEKSIYIATNNRKGPVLLDIPIDIQFAEIEENKLKHFTNPTAIPFTPSVAYTINCLKKSKRPVFLVGGGCRQANATNEIEKLSSLSKIPFVTTLYGLDSCKKSYGFAGIYGTSTANLIIKNADLIIALGTRFASQHTGKNRIFYNNNAKIIWINIDKNEKNNLTIQPSKFIACDIKNFIVELLSRFPEINISKWLKTIDSWKNRLTASQKQFPHKLIDYVLEKAEQQSIFTCDVGENQMFFAQSFKNTKSFRVLNSGNFGAMGYSLPAAIGASYLKKQVYCFTGDGGFQMNMQELNTVVLNKLNIKIFIFNNNRLGLMKYLQSKYYNNHFYGNNPNEFTCPNLEKLADVYGLQYIEIQSEQDFFKLDSIFNNPKPYLINVVLDDDITVLNRYDDKALSNENDFS